MPLHEVIWSPDKQENKLKKKKNKKKIPMRFEYAGIKNKLG